MAYVTELEKTRNVHWPYRDTDQTDTNGYDICTANRKAILDADEVHIWFSPESQGTLFDLGIAWSAQKKLTIINEVEPTPHKSFSNMILKWAGERARNCTTCSCAICNHNDNCDPCSFCGLLDPSNRTYWDPPFNPATESLTDNYRPSCKDFVNI